MSTLIHRKRAVSVVCILFSIAIVSCASFFQPGNELATEYALLEDIEVTVELTDAPVPELFRMLQEDTGFLFAWCNQDTEASPRITILKQTATVRELLDQLYVQTGLSHYQSANHVIIFKDRNVLVSLDSLSNSALRKKI